MLDLEKLEQKLDLALESETPDSLASWLLQKRFSASLGQLGVGQFENQTSINDILTFEESTNCTYLVEEFSFVKPSGSFQIAA